MLFRAFHAVYPLLNRGGSAVFGRCIQPPVPAAARHRLFCAAFNYCVLPGWNMQSKYDRIENETPGEENDNVEG